MLLLALTLLGCKAPAGPKSPEVARKLVLQTLEKRYGEKFVVTSLEHRARGLEGLAADRHVFRAYPEARESLVFDGTVDFDLSPVQWVDDYPCIRDEAPLKSALDMAVRQPRTLVVSAESTCDRDRLGSVRPDEAGAAFQWKIRLATFGPPPLEEATAAVHSAVTRAAESSGVRHITLGVDLYERGDDTALFFADSPISPAMAMWHRGATVQVDIRKPPKVAWEAVEAPGVRADLDALLAPGLPEGAAFESRVYAVQTALDLLKRDPDVRLADVPDDRRGHLEAFAVVSIVGTPEEKGPLLDAWIEAMFRRLPEGRFAPSVYLVFFDPSVDAGRPLDTQPDEQLAVWLYSASVGLRIRRDGIGGIVPITAIRYAIPP